MGRVVSCHIEVNALSSFDATLGFDAKSNELRSMVLANEDGEAMTFTFSNSKAKINKDYVKEAKNKKD